MRYFVELSDTRNRKLFELLKNRGDMVFEFSGDANDMRRGDALIFAPSKKIKIEEAQSFPENTFVFAGNISDEVSKILDGRNICHKNFMLSEIFAIKNAHLTAEGVLALILEKSPRSIYSNNILIFGAGRISKSCAILFGKLGMRYAICNYRIPNYENAFIFSNQCYLGEDYKRDIGKFDIIINTIPSPHLSAEDIKLFQKDAIYIETASFDGLDRNLAVDFQFVHAPSLPQKYACESAAALMQEFIEGEQKQCLISDLQ